MSFLSHNLLLINFFIYNTLCNVRRRKYEVDIKREEEPTKLSVLFILEHDTIATPPTAH